MSSDTPSAAGARACTGALATKSLSRFHRSLLLTARGEAYARLGRFARAVTDYDRALADAPGDETLLADRAQAWEKSGRLADAERDYTAAIARHLATAANRTNGTADILANDYAMRGRVRLESCRATAALADFDRALTLYPQGVSPELRRLRATAADHASDRRPYACHKYALMPASRIGTMKKRRRTIR